MSQNKSYQFVYFFTLIVFFGEFINIPFNTGIKPSTIIIDSCYIIMFTVSIIHVLKERKVKIDNFLIFYGWLFVSYLILFLVGNESLYTKFLSLRDKVVYLFIAVFIYKFVNTEKNIDKLLKILLNLGIIFALIGIVQYIFRNQLPVWLLTPKNTELFTYYGTDIIRSTGLLGNTIIYGNIMLLFFSIFAHKFFDSFTKYHFLGVLVTGIAILTSFSRMAIGGTLIIFTFCLFNLLRKKITKRKFLLLYMCFSLVIISGLLILSSTQMRENIENSFIVNGLLKGNNASVQRSTDIHFDFIYYSLKILSESDNLLFGVGIGTQREGSNYSQTYVYITDSALFSTLLELGVVTFIIYSLVVLNAVWYVYKSRKISKYNYLASGFLAFSIYEFLFANVINSSFLGKTSYIIYWIFLGIIISAYKINTNKVNEKLERNHEKVSSFPRNRSLNHRIVMIR